MKKSTLVQPLLFSANYCREADKIKIYLLILSVVFGAFLGSIALKDPGVVFIAFGGLSVTTSFVFFSVFIFAIFFTGYSFYKLLKRIFP